MTLRRKYKLTPQSWNSNQPVKEEVSPGMETKTDSFPSVSSVSVCSGEETWSWEALKDNKEAEDVIVQRLHVCVQSFAGMGDIRLLEGFYQYQSWDNECEEEMQGVDESANKKFRRE